MSTPQPSAGMPVIPAMQGGEEIYNRIMREIEPELTTDQIPLMEEKYKDETEEQRGVRAERYQKALDEYEKRYQAYALEEESKLHAFARGSIGFAESNVAQDDAQRLQAIESSFLS